MSEWAVAPAITHNGRVALVTGAARGIGLGIAAWLISEGWQVEIRTTAQAYATHGFQLPDDELASLGGNSGYLTATLG